MLIFMLMLRMFTMLLIYVHDACIDNVVPAMHHDATYSSHVIIASSSRFVAHGRCGCNVSHARSINVSKSRNAYHGSSISYCTFNASCIVLQI
jgi:hypothetical protein